MLSLINDFLHLFFPHNCLHCSTDSLENDALICASCFGEMPVTGFIGSKPNLFEFRVSSLLPIHHCIAGYYYLHGTPVENLVKDLKYRGNVKAGLLLGRMIGKKIAEAGLYEDIDALVPLPLHPEREMKRGYNQSLVICKGIVQAWERPILGDVVEKILHNESQTQKSVGDRALNVAGAYKVRDIGALEGKHIALVDDVVTTGATLVACGKELTRIKGVKLSLIAAAFTF